MQQRTPNAVRDLLLEVQSLISEAGHSASLAMHNHELRDARRLRAKAIQCWEKAHRLDARRIDPAWRQTGLVDRPVNPYEASG